MNKYILSFLFLFIIKTLIFTQTTVLNQNIMNSFIKNYEQIEKEILTLKIDNNILTPKVIKKHLSSKPYYNQSIENLKNYGLGDEPLDSYLTIVYGYSLLVITDEIKIANDETLKIMYNQSINKYKSVVSLEDISLIEKNRKRLYSKF